jgi:hypothetical protein
VTKQPPQARLKDGIDHVTARREELEFFNSHEPWKTELSNAKDRFGQPLRDRFGTLALQTYLSHTLTKLIRRRYPLSLCYYETGMLTLGLRLPDIKARVTEEAEKVNEDLLSLPEPPATNLVKQLCVKLINFRWAIEQAIRGANGHNKLNEEWYNAADGFAETITGSWPKLKLSKDIIGTPKQAQVEHTSQRTNPRTPGTPTPQRPRAKAVQQTICLDSDDDSHGQAQAKSRKRPTASEAAPSTPTAKRAKRAQEGQVPVRQNGEFRTTCCPNPIVLTIN